jgi:hypothetical protein
MGIKNMAATKCLQQKMQLFSLKINRSTKVAFGGMRIFKSSQITETCR